MSEETKPPVTLDLSNPAIKAAVDAIIAQETGGLKKNRDEILEEKRKLNEAYEAYKGQWGDLDPVKVKAMTAAFNQSEEAKLIADGKLEEVLNRRTEAMRADAEARVRAAIKKADDNGAEIQSLMGKISELVVDAQATAAAVKLGAQPSAIPDIVLRARQVFKVGKDFKPEARDSQGIVIVGKNGKDSLLPEEWVESQKAASPHWWPPSAGGGAGGNGSKGKGPGGLTAEQLAKMSPAEKMKFALNQGDA